MNDFFCWSVTQLKSHVWVTLNCKYNQHIWKNKNRNINFSFGSAQWASFMWIWSLLREGGIYIFAWDRAFNKDKKKIKFIKNFGKCLESGRHNSPFKVLLCIPKKNSRFFFAKKWRTSVFSSVTASGHISQCCYPCWCALLRCFPAKLLKF